MRFHLPNGLSDLLPRLRQWRNELVMWLGLITTIAAEVIMLLNGVDFTSWETVYAAIPTLLAFLQRLTAFGPQTVAEKYVPR